VLAALASDLPPESAAPPSAYAEASATDRTVVGGTVASGAVAGGSAGASGSAINAGTAAQRCALVLEPAGLQRQLLKRLLRRNGFERVLEAETVTEALALIRGEPVTLVLTPWAAPGMTGVPLLRALQRPPQDRPGAGAVPAVVLLDEGLPQPHVVSAVKAGILGRLPLPADAEGLRRVLGRLG
jgi:CheY-like chemotaxis protein